MRDAESDKRGWFHVAECGVECVAEWITVLGFMCSMSKSEGKCMPVFILLTVGSVMLKGANTAVTAHNRFHWLDHTLLMSAI